MPQPTLTDVHISAALTDVATAYLQDDGNYVADKVFPNVPVQHQANQYFKFSKSDFFRDMAKKRAGGTESAGGGYSLSTGSYSADVYAFHKDVDDQTRANADPAVDVDVASTRFVMQTLLIRKEIQFMSKYMATSIWSGASDATGTAGGTPGSTSPAFWNDDANGDPFTDIAAAQTSILQNTSYMPNTLLLTWPVYQALRKHPLVIDRIKYTNPAYAGTITPALLGAAFDVDRVLVSKAVYNNAAEGATDSFTFAAGKHALLLYTAPNPGLMIPTAGYTFSWSGYSGMQMGVRIANIPMPWLKANRIEGEMAWDMQVVGADLGAFFSGIVQ